MEKVKWIHLDNIDLSDSIIKSRSEKGYPEYYYALFDLILIRLGKTKMPIDNSKKGMMAYGKNKYHLPGIGERFYLAFKEIEIDNMVDMPTKLTTPCRSKLTSPCRSGLTTPLLLS